MLAFPPSGGAIRPPRPPRFPGIRTPGYTPDYNYLLSQDPGLMAARNNNAFAVKSAGAQRDNLLNKLRYRFSGEGNRFATTSQLDKQLKDTIFHGTIGNAARGMLHSGEQPYMEQNAHYAHDLGLYDASNSVEDQMSSALSSYLQQVQDANSSNAQAVSTASEDLAADPLYQPSSGYAQFDPALSKTSGKQVYKDRSGRYWTLDANGNTIPYSA